jgi:hypothetical protein
MWPIGKARNNDGHHNMTYGPTNSNFEQLLFVVRIWHTWKGSFMTLHNASFQTAQTRHTSKCQTSVLPVHLAPNYTQNLNNGLCCWAK